MSLTDLTRVEEVVIVRSCHVMSEKKILFLVTVQTEERCVCLKGRFRRSP